MPIDYKPFIHPEDRDALNKLQAIPGLDTLMRKFMQTVTEDMMHGINKLHQKGNQPGIQQGAGAGFQHIRLV